VYAIKIGIFDKSKSAMGVLTSRGIQKRYIEASKRRHEISFYTDLLLVNVDIIPVNASNKPRSLCFNVYAGTQIEIENEIEIETKEKEPPALMQATTPRVNGSNRIEKARALWNDLKAGPPCRLMAITFKPDDTTDCLRVMSAYSDDLIAQAMTNYSQILQSSEHEVKSQYQSFVGFIRGGVEKFVTEANPWDLFKKRIKQFETAGEREDRERAEAIARLTAPMEAQG
jgi:hypothetical protein